MNRTEFITATSIILFGAFLLGWFACWLVLRLTRPARASARELTRMTRQLHEAEEARDLAITTAKTLEADLTARLATAETELQAALAGLTDSRNEIEELRDYIEQKLAAR